MSDIRGRQRKRSGRVRTKRSKSTDTRPTLKGFFNLGLSPKEQKIYLLAEIDKAITEYAGDKPYSDGNGLRPKDEYEGDLWFEFKIPDSIEYNIWSGALLDFRKNAVKMSVTVTNKKNKKPRSLEQINYGARTRLYKKLIGKPLSKATIDDIKEALEQGDILTNNVLSQLALDEDFQIFNPNDFLNWILSGAISKNVYNALKKEATKCQLP